MRTNVFETALDGHRARYLCEILRAVFNDSKESLGESFSEPHQVKLLMPESLRRSEAYIEHIEPLEDGFEFCSLPELPRNGKFREEWARIRAIGDSLKFHPCDRLIIPYGDGLVPLQGLLPRWMQRRCWDKTTRVDAIVFRPSWAYPAESTLDGLYHRVRGFGAKRWPGASLSFLDQNVWKRVRDGVDHYHSAVGLMPELLDDFPLWPRQEALEWLSSNGYLCDELTERALVGSLVSLPGSPSLRKGAVPLTTAFVRGTKHPSATLLYWGRFPEVVERELARNRVRWGSNPRVFFCEKPVSPSAFQALFSLSDAICLPYQNDRGVSSLFLLSAIHGKRVLCDDRGWLGWASQEYGHGFAIRCSSPEPIAAGIARVLKDPKVPIASESTAQTLRVANSAEAFRQFWSGVR